MGHVDVTTPLPGNDKLGMGDLYQLFSYGHKHLGGAGELWLIYPRTGTFATPLPDFSYGPGLTLRVLPFDVETGRLVEGTRPAEDLLNPIQDS